MEGQPRGWPSFLVCSAWVRFDGSWSRIYPDGWKRGCIIEFFYICMRMYKRWFVVVTRLASSLMLTSASVFGNYKIFLGLNWTSLVYCSSLSEIVLRFL